MPTISIDDRRAQLLACAKAVAPLARNRNITAVHVSKVEAAAQSVGRYDTPLAEAIHSTSPATASCCAQPSGADSTST